ncbi:MAG: hypothetical protein WD403_00390, partial [Pirellulales bacterium]
MHLSLVCCAATVISLLATGCGHKNQPTNAVLARESLKTALDSWKEGQTPQDLKQRSPSIIVGDTAWEGGQKLESYEIVGPEFDDGVNLHCPVKLVLKDSQGSTRTEETTYIVGTSPVITV